MGGGYLQTSKLSFSCGVNTQVKIGQRTDDGVRTCAVPAVVQNDNKVIRNNNRYVVIRSLVGTVKNTNNKRVNKYLPQTFYMRARKLSSLTTTNVLLVKEYFESNIKSI